jgi:uncharacterized protein (TIGR03083 family)
VSEIDALTALRASVARLRAIVEGFGPDQFQSRAYPEEWTVADVLSHLGSSAVIMRTGLDAALAGEPVSDDRAQPVWAEWDAKSPDANIADGLAADRALLERFEALDDDERARVVYPVGPLTWDFGRLVVGRLAEHALHTWDVEVVLDPNATLTDEAAAIIVDTLGLIVQYSGKPTGTERELHVRTFDPVRDLTLTVGLDAVALGPSAAADPSRLVPDVELSADAFVRLVYGRLDPAHTPPIRANVDLDELRRMFPGV